MQEEVIQQKAPDAVKQEILFKPVSWQIKIDFINHLALFNNVLIAVLAEKEGGKTSFIHLLHKNLDAQIKPCLITDSKCDAQILTKTIADTFHLKQEMDQKISITSVINQINERRAHVLVIIDDAQNISQAWIVEVLQAIQATQGEGYFHLCLVSDYSTVSIYNALTKESFVNVVHSLELGVLNENETKTYVLQKSAHIKQADKVYTEEQFQQLYRMSGGCIAKINQHLITFKLASTRLRAQRARQSAKRASWAFTGMFILAISVFGLSEFLPVNPSGVEVAKEEIHQPLVSEIANFQSHSTRQLVYIGLPKRQILAALEESDLEDRYDAQVYVDKVIVIPKINIKKALHISEKLEPSYIEPVLFSPKIAHPASKNIKPAEFTIQLLASHNIKDIHRFIHTYKLQDKGIIRKTTRNGDSWYILTLGEFQTMEQANAAIGNLETRLTQFKPWIRAMVNLEVV